MKMIYLFDVFSLLNETVDHFQGEAHFDCRNVKHNLLNPCPTIRENSSIKMVFLASPKNL